MAAGFFLLIFGGKLWFIDRAGSDLPTWDQWDGEWEQALRPWLEGRLTVANLIHGHNEHRVLTTRLYALGLFLANGQWDAFVETAGNAAIHTGLALMLLLIARRHLRGPWLLSMGLLLVLLFTLPFSWENALFGFQVSFYFMLLFSVGHIWLTLRSDQFSVGWGIGQLCGLLVVGTLASGLLSAAAVLCVLAYRLLRNPRWTAQQAVTAALCLALCALGWIARCEVEGHRGLFAHNFREFAHGLLTLLSWPCLWPFPWGFILFIPTAIFVVRLVRTPALGAGEAVLLGLLAWVLLQFLALAYARSGGGIVVAPRYLDLLAVHVALGFVFLGRETSGIMRRVIVPLWLTAVVFGLFGFSRQGWNDFVSVNIGRQKIQETNVRGFLETGDSTYLLGKPWGEIPYPSEAVLLDRLSHPAINSIMPVSVRRALPLRFPSPSARADLPPSLPPAPGPVALSTWSSDGGGTMRTWISERLPAAALPILRFRVAGDLGAPGHALRLVVKSADAEVPISPESAPGGRWKTVNVFRPRGEWWIEAADGDNRAWFAITAPVELGRLSWFVEKLLKYHGRVIFAGALFLVAGSAIMALNRSASHSPRLNPAP